MTAYQLKRLLHKLKASRDIVAWAKGKDLHEFWIGCERGDWLLWLANCMVGELGWHTRQQVVLGACACAEAALKYVKPGDDRPRKPIETMRAWARGEASLADADAANAGIAYYTYAANGAYDDKWDPAYYAVFAAYYASKTTGAYARAAVYDAAIAYAAYANMADATYDAGKWRSNRDLALAKCAVLVRCELPEPCLGEKYSPGWMYKLKSRCREAIRLLLRAPQ